jgi:hypothetical protein
MSTLYDVKVGDIVLFTRAGNGKFTERLLTVKRVTETLIIGENDNRYSKHTGSVTGRYDEWSFTKIAVATEDTILRVKTQDRMRKRMFIAYDKLKTLAITEETIDAFEALITLATQKTVTS